mmetsp:Transcript_18486/g.59612  ORF Transcript_18486/g.59612 Transcript_18486/m.59612 type:complete len:777 (+) Transcript_18486:1-2331(+)
MPANPLSFLSSREQGCRKERRTVMMGPSFLFVPLVLLVPGVSSQSVVPSGLEFRSQLRKAMARAKTLLESDDVREATSYEDKFRVANFVSHLTFNATQFVLVETFGTKEGGVEKQEGWSCDFVTAREREVAPKRVVERTDTGTFGKTTSTESQRDVVTEYVWKEAYRAHYDAVDLRGGIGDEEDSSSSFQQGKKEKKKKKTRLATYVSETERAGTKRDVPPCRRGLRVEEPFIVDVTLPDADVERAPKTTPRRNPQVDRFLERIADLRRLFVFEHRKDTAFLGVAPVAANAFFVVDDAGKKDSIDSHENAASAEEEEKQPLFLQLADAGKLLGEFRRTFEEQREKSEDALAFGLAALGRLFDEYQGAVAYLEDLLFEDLRKAVGKDLTSADFDAFWDRHERANLFRPEYAPLPFSYLVRRSPTSFPDGKVALVRHSKKKKQKDDVVQRNFLLETDAEEEPEEPAKTLRRDLGERSWRVSLGAAAECAVRGETFSHAYVSHDFAEDPPSSLAVKASARQFSSFLLVLGSVLPGSSIEPSHAVVVKNRDELTIPLVLDALPSPKAFDDAIQGLSPEQRQFCLAYRRMQLSSSLVGLLIVPIEPNVERVLNLDAGSLVKEIQLTDQLVSLFVDEQISTDLLKNDDDDDDLLEDDDLKDNKATTKRASAAAKKIAVVKRRVDDVNAVLRVAVDADLSNEKKKAQYRGYAAWQQGQQSGSLDEELVEDAIPIRRSSFAARGGKERLRGGAPPFAEEAAYASTSNFALLMASSSSSSLGEDL